MSLAKHLEAAHAALESGDIPAAASALTSASREKNIERRDASLASLSELVSRLATAAGLDPLVEAADAADPSDTETLFILGYQLVEFDLAEVAVPYLRRVRKDMPQELRVVTELAAALERSGRHAEARDTLLATPESLSEYWPRYLVCFNSIFAGDLDTAREHAPELNPSDDTEGSREATERILDMLRRADAITPESPLDPSDLRGWHYVLNGGALLHLSPYGFDEGMNGRYAFFQDGVSGIRRDLDALVAALGARGERPNRVLHLDDHGSRVIALALSKMLGVETSPWSPGAEGLTVAYDMASIELTYELVEGLREGGTFFIRCACWTSPPPTPPDFLGYLHQVNIEPWGEVMSFDQDSGEMKTSEPSTDSAEQWAARILEAGEQDGHDEADEDADEDAIDSIEALLAFIARAPALRADNFWEGGPVQSGRFG